MRASFICIRLFSRAFVRVRSSLCEIIQFLLIEFMNFTELLLIIMFRRHEPYFVIPLPSVKDINPI